MPPKLANSLHSHHFGIFFSRKKEEKKDLFWFCWLFFWLSRFLTGVFFVEQCLERETDTKTSPTLDFALQKGSPRERKALIAYLNPITHCVCVLAFTSTEALPLFVAFGSHLETDTSNLVLFFWAVFHAVFLFAGGDGNFWRSFLHGLLGAASRR